MGKFRVKILSKLGKETGEKKKQTKHQTHPTDNQTKIPNMEVTFC